MKAKLLPAALAGFQLIRRSPGAALSWGALYFGVLVVPMVLMFGLIAQPMSDSIRLEMSDPNAEPPVEFIGAIFMMMGLIPLMLVAMVVVMLVNSNAIWRAVLRPEKKRWAYMRLGADEGRSFVVILVLYVLFNVAAMIPMTLIMVPAMAMFIGPMMELSTKYPDPSLLPVDEVFRQMIPFYAVMLGGELIVYAGLAWPFARLALALPMTLAEGKIRIFEGWKISRCYGWSLWRMMMLVWMGVFAAEIALGVGLWAGSWFVLGRPGLGDLEAWVMGGDLIQRLLPVYVAGAVVSFGFIVVSLPVTLAPLARAYQLIVAASADKA